MHLPRTCLSEPRRVTALQDHELETSLLRPRKGPKPGHSILTPSVEPISLDAWVASEEHFCPQSHAREARRRIQAVQRGESKELHLNKLNLGSVPPLVGCVHITLCDLGSNRLRQIPNTLGDVPNIKVLIPSGNMLRKIPPFEQYPALEWVNVRFNPIRRLPASLRKRRIEVDTMYTLLTISNWGFYLACQREKRLRAFLTRFWPGAVEALLPPLDTTTPDFPLNWHKL